MRCPECGSDGPHTDTAGWRTCGTCHASWMVDPGRQVARRHGNGTVETYVDELNDRARAEWEANS